MLNYDASVGLKDSFWRNNVTRSRTM